MSGRMNKRILRDISIATKNQDYQFLPSQKEGEYYMIIEVPNGIYKGQKHVIHMKLNYGDYSYPKDPPLCTFMTPIWHPNIGVTGIICVDTLKDKWSAIMTIDNIWAIIILLLSEPNTDSPQNAEAANHYINDYDDYKEYVHEYYKKNQGLSIVDKILNDN